MVEVGSSGLIHSVGRIAEAALRELRGREGAKRFREMGDLSAVCGASLLVYQLLCRRVTWRVEAADDSADAKARQEFGQQCVDDMDRPFDAVISEDLTMLQYGWAYCEKVFKVRNGEKPGSVISRPGARPVLLPKSRHDDGLIGWHKIALRGQETLDHWDLDPSGEIRGMWQLDMSSGKGLVLIPREKACLFRTSNVKNNPEGRSILTAAWSSWRTVKRVMESEAIGIHRDLNGIPVMRVPVEVMASKPKPEDAAARGRAEQLVTGIANDDGAGILIPAVYDASGKPLWEISLLASSGTRNFDTGAVISRYEHRMATAMLTAFLLLGQDNVGTQSLAENNSDMLLDAINGVCKSVADVYNLEAFPDLMRVNGWPLETCPRLVFAPVRRAPTLKEFSEYLTALTNMGVPLLPDEDREAELLAKVDLKPPSPEARQAAEAEKAAKEEAAAAALEALQSGGGPDPAGSGAPPPPPPPRPPARPPARASKPPARKPPGK